MEDRMRMEVVLLLSLGVQTLGESLLGEEGLLSKKVEDHLLLDDPLEVSS